MPLRAAIAVGLCAAIFAVYFQVGGHEFVGYDDIPIVIEEPGRCTPIGVGALRDAFTTMHHANFVPITRISHQIDCSLYGTEPRGHLLSNVVLHALNTALLLLFLVAATGATAPSAFVAGVFALHPLQVEAVAWASGRRELLCGFFWMLTLLAHLRYCNQRSARRYAAVVGSLVLALLAKPMAVTLPFVLLLLDYWPLGRLRAEGSGVLPDPHKLRGALLEKLPLFALIAAAAFVTARVQVAGGNLTYGESLGQAERMMNVGISYGRYVAQSFWPSDLAVFYPFPIGGPSAVALAASLIFVAVASGIAIATLRDRPYFAVGWLWYLGTLVPVVGFVQTEMQAHADRYLYLPQIGLSIALAWGAAGFAQANAAKRGLAAIAGMALLALALCSHAQVGYWRDSIALFARAVEVTRDNHIAHHNLGAALGQAGHIEEALAHQAEAQRILQRAAEARRGGGR